MKYLIVYTLLIFSAAVPVRAQDGPFTPESKEGKSGAASPSRFTWWNDVPALIDEGNKLYKEEKFDEAASRYREAELKDREESVAAFNLGLAQAGKEQFGAAADSFEKAGNLAGTNAQLRAEAKYNRGLARFSDAQLAKEREEHEDAIEKGLEALDAFNAASTLNPADEKAKRYADATRQFLHQFSLVTPTPTPTPTPQQGQPQPGDEGEMDMEQLLEMLRKLMPQMSEEQLQEMMEKMQEPMSEEQMQEMTKQIEEALKDMDPEQLREMLKEMGIDVDEMMEQQQEGEGQEQEQEGEGQEQEGEGKEQEQEQSSEDPAKPSGPSSSGKGKTESRDLTEEEAEQLLNLLGDEEHVTLRKGAGRRPIPEKDW